MARDKKSKLSDTVKSLKKELSRDNGDSEDFRGFQYAIEKALEEGRIPIECIEEIEIADGYYVKSVVMKEC